MDIRKTYTPTEANTMYNVAKIRFDPTSYSLKGHLITGDTTKESLQQHIAAYGFEGEAHLVHTIENKESTRPESVKITGLSNVRNLWHYYDDTVHAAIVQQDNLHVCLQTLNSFIDVANIKHTNVMQTILNMCIALNSQKSCAKDMLWLATVKMNFTEYERVHTFEHLKEALRNNTEIIWCDGTGTVNPRYLPTVGASGKAAHTLSEGVDSLYSLAIASFEVMWAWSKLPDAYKTCFVQMCRNTMAVGPTDGMELFDKIACSTSEFTFATELHDAIAIDDPAARYKAYQDILTDRGALYKHCDHCHGKIASGVCIINPIFAMFTSFVMQLSLTNIRINTIRVLHNYCTTHGYLEPDSITPGDEDVSSIFSSVATGSASGAESEEEDPSKSLIDFSKHTTGSGKGGASHDDTAVFEALDATRAEFTAGKYKFITEDMIDTSDTYKGAYERITSKVNLINKLLVRRIRDIKTYNVGGKESGKPSGRLDKKALYRYKYDSNIFYNNTYKTLESDLAFGIILDESGSMSGRGIEDGKITMIVLHETLKALGINHSIIGHTSHGDYESNITRYQAFKEDKTYKLCKNYALIKASAKCGNCDSGALYYMEKAMSRVRNKDKICLIFSDGAPTECSGTDLINQVAHMERNGIKVIGIGIKFDKISKYYKSYANGSNLTEMLNIVAEILEEYVLKKKDK